MRATNVTPIALSFLPRLTGCRESRPITHQSSLTKLQSLCRAAGYFECISGGAVADHQNGEVFRLEGRNFLGAEGRGVQDAAVVDFPRVARQGFGAADPEVDRKLARAVRINGVEIDVAGEEA
jgi:hypothetical protein